MKSDAIVADVAFKTCELPRRYYSYMQKQSEIKRVHFTEKDKVPKQIDC